MPKVDVLFWLRRFISRFRLFHTMTQYDVVGQEYLSARKEKESIKEKESKDFILKEVDFHNKLVLDIGCGAGEDFAHFENNGAKEVYGLDNSEFMINKAKRIVKNPENVVFADVYQLPFPDAKFDIIIAKHSLHYLTNFDGALKEIVGCSALGSVQGPSPTSGPPVCCQQYASP